MGKSRGVTRFFGIIFLLFGFLYFVTALSNSEEGVDTQFMIGIVVMFIGALIYYAGNKLKSKAEIPRNTEHERYNKPKFQSNSRQIRSQV